MSVNYGFDLNATDERGSQGRNMVIQGFQVSNEFQLIEVMNLIIHQIQLISIVDLLQTKFMRVVNNVKIR
jgi:hypothetical protein